jgi:hypothetical protein
MMISWLGNFRRSRPTLLYIFESFPEEVLYTRWREVYKVVTSGCAHLFGWPCVGDDIGPFGKQRFGFNTHSIPTGSRHFG